ncbi:MAG: DUF6263 family protein [Planctomycetota bacterium]
MKHVVALSSILALGLAPALTAQAHGKAIVIKPTAGARTAYRNTVTAKQVMAAFGQESTSEIVSEFTAQVDEVADDGAVKASFTWTHVRGKLGSPMGGEMEFDTAKDTEEDGTGELGSAIEACHALVGKTVTLTYGPDGKVKDRKPLVDLVDAALERAEGMGRMAIQQFISAENLEMQVSVFGTFPTEPVAVGGDWTETREATRGGMHMRTDTTNKLDTADADSYVVSTQGKISIAPDKKAKEEEGDDDPQVTMMKSMMREATIEASKLVGSYTVSRKDGLVSRAESDVDLTIQMPNPMGGDQPFVVKVHQKTRQERVAEAAAGKADKKADAKKK